MTWAPNAEVLTQGLSTSLLGPCFLPALSLAGHYTRCEEARATCPTGIPTYPLPCATIPCTLPLEQQGANVRSARWIASALVLVICLLPSPVSRAQLLPGAPEAPLLLVDDPGWELLNPPPARSQHAAAWDPVRN